jgi:hypothetical protein
MGLAVSFSLANRVVLLSVEHEVPEFVKRASLLCRAADWTTEQSPALLRPGSTEPGSSKRRRAS